MRSPAESIRWLLSVARVEAYRWRARRTVHIVRRRDNTEGFAALGDPGSNLRFVRHYLRTTDRADVSESRTWRPTVNAEHIRDLAREFGLVVMDPWAVPDGLKNDVLAHETWVRLSIPLPDSLDDYKRSLSGSTRDNLRVIRKQGYRSAISLDQSLAREFHDKFHRPAVTGRHGDEGFCSPPEDIATLIAETGSEWLRIFSGEECVAMVIGQATDNGYVLHRLGWRDGDPDLVKRGVVSAIYWFAVQRTMELGLRQVRLGAVSSCLEDGLFSYKTAWGGRLLPERFRHPTKHLLIDPAHRSARGYLERHSLLIRVNDDRFFVLSSRRPTEVVTYAAHASSIAGWFRLRAAPVDHDRPEVASLPASLRKWYDAERLPAEAPSPAQPIAAGQLRVAAG